MPSFLKPVTSPIFLPHSNNHNDLLCFTDEGSSESDSQEDYPGLAPLPSPSSDEEWLPEVDTSQGDDLDPQAPSASRLKIPRLGQP